MAGVPFESVERLATPETIKAARESIATKSNAGPESQLKSLEHELASARTALWEAGRNLLAPYLVFAVGGVRELLAHLLDVRDLDFNHRNSRAGDRERHLLLYLQRVAAKNDTFSRFGPTTWGRIDDSTTTLKIDIRPGIASRDVFLERWTAHAVAASINAEGPETKVEVPALQPHAFETLLEDVQKWKLIPERERWMSILQPIAALPKRFAAATETEERQSIQDEGREKLGALGAVLQRKDRFLFAAANPIGEECFRESNFTINETLISEIAVEAAPWIDFWRDTYAFVASRVAAGLRAVLDKVSTKNGGAPLPEFLHACELAKLPLTGPGLVALADVAFQEVKAAFREQMKPHAAKPEYELTVDDCRIVRRKFQYPKFEEYTYPSADLQIDAESIEAVANKNYRWILAELHPAAALLQHCMYWACPDKPALHAAIARTTCNKPNFYFGLFAADFTAHTTVHLFDALPDLTNFVAPQRPHPRWRSIAPSAVEVYADETGDVALRRIENREYLGSFARGWVIGLGFHPFQFGLAPHMPRLRCGKIVVQRRAWVVTQEELPKGKFTGVSRDLVLAIERLRAQRDLPRYAYIRPTEQALRRSGAEGRDKDTKPVFVDLESYLFLEIFYRWLIKAGELEVTEMLPDPDHLLWREPDGRRTFELRALIIPSS